MRLIEDRWLRRAFSILCLVSLVPIWIVRYHPLTDIGNHLAAVAVMRHLHDPSWDFERYYRLSIGVAPYWIHYGPLYLLSWLMSLDLANRLLLSAWVVGLPLSVLMLVRQFGRSPWLSLFAFPFVWNYSFMWGFFSCVAGFALSFVALALFDRFCAAPSWRAGILVGLLGGALYLCHLLCFGLFLGAAGLVGLVHEGRTWKRLRQRAAVWATSVAVGVACFSSGRLLNVEAARRHVTFRFYSLGTHFQVFHTFLWGQCAAHWDLILGGVLLLAWVGLRLSRRREPLKLHDLRMEACLAVAAGAYLLLPRSLLAPKYWWGINIRYAPLTALFLLLCVRGTIEGRRRFWLAPVFAAALLFVSDVTVHFVREARFVDGFDEVTSLVEPGKRILWVIHPPWRDPSYGFDHARTMPQLYQAYHGGYMAWNFDEGFPLRYKVRYPGGDWSRPDFTWQSAQYYDYVVFFQGNPGFEYFSDHPEVTLIKAAGSWSLWRLPGPRTDTPPRPPY